MNNIPETEILDKQISEWCLKTFKGDFSFRKYQKELAIDIIQSFFIGTKYYISECPTGFGKSYMAFMIAGVLSEYYGKTGYILCSDLSLTKQYSDDLKRYLPEWGNLMGQQNYTCIVNGYPFKLGVCHLAGLTSYNDICTKFPECSNICEYILERQKAISAPVTVCTYHQWLTQLNIVKHKLKEQAPFDDRNFVICDEAHNIMDIVQNQYAPRMTKDDINKFKAVSGNSLLLPDKDAILNNIESIRKDIYEENNNIILQNYINDYCNIIQPIADEADTIKKMIGRKSDGGKKLSPEDKSLIYSCDFVSDHYTKFCEYSATIAKIGYDCIVKNDSVKDEHDTIIFNCIKESYLMGKVFHSHITNGLFMSATIGNDKIFANEIGISEGEYRSAQVPSTFDYTKSPIIYVDEYKMKYTEKEYAFPRILNMVERILEKYPDQQGIIQTGNYENVNKIYNSINSKYKDRIIKYDNSLIKQDVLDIFKKGGTNKVLIGPTLIEGIDLKDDLCRFQIIFKIPYPNLSDKFVAAKKNNNPIWYINKTCLSILQGIGRAVRNEHDYADTYILDGCFDNLLKSYPFNYEFMNRLKYKKDSEI